MCDHIVYCFIFCKKKTAYERRISDWSSDVCSSDLFSALVTGFRFQAETAEVVTDHGVAVEALVVVHAGDRVAGGASVAGGESDVLIFDENNAGVDADIPAIVTRQGRGDRKSTRLNSSH